MATNSRCTIWTFGIPGSSFCVLKIVPFYQQKPYQKAGNFDISEVIQVSLISSFQNIYIYIFYIRDSCSGTKTTAGGIWFRGKFLLPSSCDFPSSGGSPSQTHLKRILQVLGMVFLDTKMETANIWHWKDRSWGILRVWCIPSILLVYIMIYENIYLVFGWTNPFETICSSNWIISPGFGMNIKNIWVSTTKIWHWKEQELFCQNFTVGKFHDFFVKSSLSSTWGYPSEEDLQLVWEVSVTKVHQKPASMRTKFSVNIMVTCWVDWSLVDGLYHQDFAGT